MPVPRPRKRSWQAMNEETGPPVMLNRAGTRQRVQTARVHQSTDAEGFRMDIDFGQIFEEGWENEETGSEDENEEQEGAEKDRDEDEEDRSKDEEDVDNKDDADMDEEDRDDEDQDDDTDQEDRDDEDEEEEDKEDKEGEDDEEDEEDKGDKEDGEGEGDEEDDAEMNEEHGEDREDDEDNDEEEQEQEHPNIPDSHRSSRKRGDMGKRCGNIFIDDEADGGETSEASDVDDEGPSPFIDDGEHTDSEREPDEEFNANYLRNGSREDQQYYWDKLLDRAYNRVKGGERWTRAIGMEADVEDDDEYMITTQDLLWVVPCMEGHEEDAVFTIFDRATNPTSPNIAGASATFNPSHPRHIYIEAPNARIARATVDGIPGLFPSKLNLVPHSERERCVSHTPRRMPLWVRIHDSRAKWRAVNGTVGIMVPLLNNYDVPETWTVVVASKDPLEASAPWIWEAVNISDIRFKINPDELPTVRDVQKFVGCDLLNEYTLKVLFKRIYRTNLCPGARVCITSGEFVGLIGEVVASVGAAATVRLGNGAVEPIPLDVLRRVFVIGDQVMIATLPWRGVTGWVVSTEADHVTIWSDLQQKEYRVNSLEVEFFSPSFHQTFLLPPQIKCPNISMFDIYQRFKGRTVYVTGHHPFKGQRGTIKDMHPDGRVWIQMESMLSGNQSTVFKHTKLALIDDKTERHLLPLNSKDVTTTRNAVPFADARQSSTARTSYEGTNPDTPFEASFIYQDCNCTVPGEGLNKQ
ncbi:hypothetical protein BJ165DRAFT_1534315 [Panaeolus papilionaceus]|nr:hypothetical protein BJ165DRAFT_1534315 [Panaeolus papilionaceus]